MKQFKVAYWVSTGVMCLVFCFSALMYFFNYETMAGFFEQLGFPTWLLYPMAVLKLLGVVAVLSRKSALLKEWAYAGFFFDASLAFTSHTIAGDGQGGLAAIALLMLIVSRYFDPKVFGKD